MKRVLYSVIIVFALFFNLNLFLASEVNSTMRVNVDLIGFNTSNRDEISIEIPDYVDLGQVSKTKLVSSEEGIDLNNTGTVDIKVTPVLIDEDKEIFKWLFFRNYKNSSSHPDEMIPKIIEDYSVEINAPSPGKTSRSKHIYMQLNLTDFDGTIKQDALNYQAELVFLATAK